MALIIDTCRVMIDVKNGMSNIQISVSDESDKDLKKSKSLTLTLTPQLLTSMKTEINTALTTAGLPVIP